MSAGPDSNLSRIFTIKKIINNENSIVRDSGKWKEKKGKGGSIENFK